MRRQEVDSAREVTVKVTSKQEEATKYLETGFEWVGVKDNLIFLRKRK
jgi:hypothetical protein